jgi:hypothetical protein
MRMAVLKYLIIVTACIAVVLFFSRDHIPFGKNNSDFAVKPGIEITGVNLLMGNRRVLIRQSGDSWTVNKTGEARESAVLFLIKTLKEIKIKSPVTGDIFKSEIADKRIEPVRVVVYHKRRPVKSFYVYRTPSNQYGNIMKMRPTSKPYIVFMPGYDDNIGSHFIPDVNFWLPFTAISYLPSEIQSVELASLRDTSGSFHVIRKANRFNLSERAPDGCEYDSLKVRRYISYFTSVSFESWATDMTDNERREIESSVPLYRIKIITNDAKEVTLTIWERIREAVSGEKDTDRVWAEKNDGKGIFIMRYFDLDPILKKKSYFCRG